MFFKALTVFSALYVIALVTSMSGMELFSSLIIATLLLGCGTGKISPIKLKEVPFIKPIGVFILIAVIGILLSDEPVKLKLYNISRMRFFLIYVFLLWGMRVLSGRFQWIKYLTWILPVICLYGFVQHFIAIDLIRPEGKKVLLYAMQEEKIGPLVVGTFNHHLTFANIFLFYACLFFTLGVSTFPRKKWQLILGLFLFLLIAWTHSRAAWIAIPVSIFCIALKLGRRKASVFLLITLLCMAGTYIISPSVRERFNQTFSSSKDLSVSPRFHLWKAQFEMFKENPIFGIGWNNNERHAKEYIDRLFPEDIKNNFYGHAHSEILQVLSSTGLLGLIAYLWIWFEIFRRNYLLARVGQTKEKQWLAVALLAGFIGFHIQGVTQWNFGDAEVVHNVMFFWAVLATL